MTRSVSGRITETDGGRLEQLRAVHRLTAALHDAGSHLAFYERAVESVVGMLGVDRASLLLFDADGVMRFKAWKGLSRGYRQAVEGHTPWSPEDTGVSPILVADVKADASLSEYQPVFEAEGIGALAFVPLIHGGRVVGKFMLYYGGPHDFTAEEVAVAEIVAAHVALALERRRAEDELRRHQEHLELALSAGEMGTWEWDIESGTVVWSPSLEVLHGLPPGRFAGTFEAFQTDIHPEDRPRVLAAIRDVVESDRDVYAVTYRVLLADGSTRWLSASGQVLRDADGQPRRLIGVCGDVTERERLLEAERASSARLASLQRVTAELSRAVTVADVAGVVLGLALRELGARSGSLCLVDGDSLEIVDAFGYPEDVMGHWRRFPLDADLPASEAVRTGRAVLLRSPEERDARYPTFASSPVVGDEAFAVVPLKNGGVIGTLVLGFEKRRQFSPEDEAFYSTLAGQCAAALVRAQLYEDRERAQRAAEQTRDRLAFLVEASEVLTASLDPEEMLRAVADRVVTRLADWCAIHLLENRQIALAAIAHRDPARMQMARDLVERYPATLDDRVGVGAVIRSGAPEVYRRVDEELLALAARAPEHLEQLRDLELHAALVVPLVARGRVIGALSLVNGPAHDIDDDIVALAGELASRAAIALDNARLFQQRTDIARTLQASLLPPELPSIPGVEIAARYVAGSAGADVGGDFYDVFALDERRFVAVVGDVCGRGVDAATLAVLSRHAVRSAAITLRNPAAILGHLNEVLLRQTPADCYEPRFCTAVVAVLDLEDGASATMAVAAAGHPLPLLRDAAGDVRPVGSGGSLVGVLPELVVAEDRVRLGPGDAVVCFTDGVTERRNADGFFGDGPFIRTVASAGGDADALAAAIEDAVVSFADVDLTDDLAVLVLRIPPAPAGDSRA